MMLKKLVVIIVMILALFTGWVSWLLFGPAVSIPEEKAVSINIVREDNFSSVLDSLEAKNLVRHPSLFHWLAQKKGYTDNIKPGHYKLSGKIGYNRLVNMLRGGWQTPVKVTFTHQKSLAQLAGILSRQLAFDSLSMLTTLADEKLCQEYGLTPATIGALFIPNTYEVYWTISPQEFIERMKSEFDRYWNKERKEQASALGLTPLEVITLASIIEEEVRHPEEMPIIAGVYLNRLHRGMRLQADPTIKFALGDMSRRRILTKDLQIDSPYNTYRYAGLPPGPISIPSINALEAVLHAEKNDYLYFVAKEDFSGYHYFSKTLREHNNYARKYRSALNRNRIYQ